MVTVKTLSPQGWKVRPELSDLDLGFLEKGVLEVDPSVGEIAQTALLEDLAILRQGLDPPSSSLAPIPPRVRDSINAHPLGFLAKDLPHFADALAFDAIQEDAVHAMKALNSISGGDQEVSDHIAQLQYSKRGTTDTLFAAIPSLIHRIQRNAIDQAATVIKELYTLTDDALWGSTETSEAQLRSYFRQASDSLHTALHLYDQGHIEAALTHYGTALEGSEGHIRWLSRAVEESEAQKFAVLVGGTAVVGGLAAWAGGASLVAMTGSAEAAASAGFGSQAASMAISGLTFTAGMRALDPLVFDRPFFPKDSPGENAIDFIGEVLHNTVLFSWMLGVGLLGRTLPVYEGEMAMAVNAAQHFAWEFTGLTGFNLYSTAALQVVDTKAPGMETVVSPEALIQNLAFLAGLKVGNASLRATGDLLTTGAQRLRDWGAEQAFASFPLMLYAGSPFRLKDYMEMTGMAARPAATIMKDIVVDPPAFESADPRTLKEIVQDVEVGITDHELQRLALLKPGKFWTALALRLLGVPNALIAYKVFKLSPKRSTDERMQLMDDLLASNSSARNVADRILASGLGAVLQEAGKWGGVEDGLSPRVAHWSKAITGAQFVQKIIAAFGEAAGAVGHTVGLELEYLYPQNPGAKDPVYEALAENFDAHLMAQKNPELLRFAREQFGLPGDAPVRVLRESEYWRLESGDRYMTVNADTGLANVDGREIQLSFPVDSSRNVELEKGSAYFIYGENPYLFPVIRGGVTSSSGEVVKFEVITGTGAIIVQVTPDRHPSKAEAIHPIFELDDHGQLRSVLKVSSDIQQLVQGMLIQGVEGITLKETGGKSETRIRFADIGTGAPEIAKVVEDTLLGMADHTSRMVTLAASKLPVALAAPEAGILQPIPLTIQAVPVRVEKAEQAVNHAIEAVARYLGLSFEEVKGLQTTGGTEHYVESYLLMAKANDNDIFKVGVSIDPKSGKATLSPLNGEIVHPSFPREIVARSLREVTDYFGTHLPGITLARKSDAYKQLLLHLPGGEVRALKLTDEADPYSEFVSWILTAKHFPYMEVLARTLADLGCKGTREDRLIGIHTHSNLPLKDSAGRFTIAPVVGMMRGFLENIAYIQGIFPSQPNRKNFIKDIPPSLKDRILDPDYVQDPTDPVTILRVMADIAGVLSKKYSAINLDNHVAKLLEKMIEEGVLSGGQVLEVRWNGEHDFFEVHKGGRPELYNVTRVKESGEEVSLMRIGVPEVRKPTSEIRIFDTIIDPEYVKWVLEFSHAFGWWYGTGQFLKAAGELLPTEPPPSDRTTDKNGGSD